jgi:flagellar basal-body rod protein FlgB
MSSLFAGVTPLHAALDYHLERQNLLSSNVANVETPGYHPVDLARVESLGFESVMHVALRRTESRHLSGVDVGIAENGRVFEDLSAGAGRDGNYVSLDREAAKVAANQLRYDVVATMIQQEMNQLRFAATDAKG